MTHKSIADRYPPKDECDRARISRLEYAPYRVYQELGDDGELRPDGHSDLIDGTWNETDSFWCHGCDSQLGGEDEAMAHVEAARRRA